MQNDLKTVMNTIETSMPLFFKNEKEKENTNNTSKNNNTNNTNNNLNFNPDEILVSVEDSNNIDKEFLLPFAWVNAVEAESPANIAGLMPNDGIVLFDNLKYGDSNNYLQVIAGIVNKKVNEAIRVIVIRGDSGLEERINLKLIPTTWAGKGLLGCKLSLTKP